MPILTSHPSAVDTSEWTAFGSDAVGAVGSNDGDTSYIAQNNSTRTNLYTMPDLPSNASTVNSIVERMIARHFGSSGPGPIQVVALRTNGAWDGGHVLTATYTEYSATWISGLTVANANAAQSGVQGIDDSGGENRVTELWRVTDYNLGGDMLSIMFSLLLPVVGVGLTLAQLASFNAAVLKPAGHHYRKSELTAALESWRAYRAPRFSFGGVDALR